MSNNNKTPAIRFKGFTDTWEQRKLGDMCDEFQSGKSIKASDITDSGEYAVYGGNGFRGYTDTYNHDGDYALIGRQGALCGNMNFSSGKAYFTEHAIAVHGNADNDTLFLYYLLDLMNLGQYSGQSAQPGLAVNKIIQLKTKAPKLDEQRLISSFFKQLDSLITLHQRKYDKLIQFKAAMLQKMFPQNGADKPEIRFKGFTDAWEQRELGECMETVTDYVAAGSFADIADHVQYKNSPDYAQLIRTVDLKHEFRNSDYVYVDKKAFDYLWRVNLNEECIVLPNIGANIGEVYYIAPLSLPYEFNVLGPNAILLKTKDSTKFMFTLLQADDFQNKLYVSIASSGQPKFNKTELKSIKILIPQSDEQEKIRAFFSKLDNLITLHQRKCDKYKSIKAGLIRKLFP